ncbi:hypothetical protein L7F22_040179 [Adiantum nelumboides]|nr:hypothetical protein [Adiantum nelumboides]
MSAVLALPRVKDFLKTLAKGKEKGQDQGKEHDVNAQAVTEEEEPSKKPWDEDIPELWSPSYSPPTSFSYSSDSSSSSNPRRRNFSSAYHPETDGQSEIVNSTVLDLLKCYVSDKQTEWKKYLPLVEFAYNNTIHSSTGKASFEVIYGKPHLPPILLTKDKIFAADEFVRDIEAAYSQVRRAITRSQEIQKKAADKHKRRLDLQLGQYVLLKFPKARLKKQRQAKGKVVKLLTRNLPPELPSPEPPEVEDQEEILVPEQIIHHQDRTLKSGSVHRKYLLKFKNYSLLRRSMDD